MDPIKHIRELLDLPYSLDKIRELQHKLNEYALMSSSVYSIDSSGSSRTNHIYKLEDLLTSATNLHWRLTRGAPPEDPVEICKPSMSLCFEIMKDMIDQHNYDYGAHPKYGDFLGLLSKAVTDRWDRPEYAYLKTFERT